MLQRSTTSSITNIESRYFLSFSVDLDCLVLVSKLTFPPDGLGGSIPPRGEDLRFTAHIYCHGQPLHHVPVSTSACPHKSSITGDLSGSSLSWEEVMTFPVKVCDLAHNARLVFTAWTADGEAFGGTSMPLFENSGVLRTGRQKLVFYVGSGGDGSLRCQTPGETPPCDLKEDNGFRVTKAKEAYETGACGRVHWLDSHLLTLADKVACDPEASRASRSPVSDNNAPFPLATAPMLSWCPSDLVLATTAFLEIDLPTFAFPVVHEERPYPRNNVPGSTGRATTRADKLGGKTNASSNVGANDLIHIPPVCYDYENDANVTNPSEEMRRKLMHDQLRGVMDPDLKPDTLQRKLIDTIISDPSDSLTNEEKDLLWMFGYTLTSRPNAVVKFVLAVYWDNEEEVATATTLLARWQQPDIAYALKLLSDYKEFQHMTVRGFAVKRLEAASDDELELYLMQLVAALRYEPKLSEDADNIPGTRESLEESFMTARLKDSAAVTASSSISPLATFLIQRACACQPPYSFANFLYYFLKVESEADERYGKMYSDVFKSYLSSLPDHISRVLRDQHAFTEGVSECQLKAFNTKGNRDVKQKEMSTLLTKLGKELKGKTAPSPVNPNILLTGVDSNVKMFQSALYPAAVTFSVEPSEEAKLKYERDMEEARTLSSNTDGMSARINDIEKEFNTKKKLKMMIKNGDDVRQDQLILQMFRVMDRCLKRVGLDLKLTIYGVLATSPKSGFMEFVCAEDGSPSSAIELLDMSIGDYLRLHQPAKADDDGDQGISKEGLEVFASSMAGYAVLTYILGVGDRHLGNLLMLPNGRMCHIDFGFVFGDDPKKKFVNPPPFRITKSMVDVMGGQKGEVFQQIFCRKAFGAYKELRHNAVLVMSLLRLMKDSGIEALMENREAKLQTVEDRFRLDLNDEDAEIFMAGIIQESMTHVGIQVLEGFHNIARIMR